MLCRNEAFYSLSFWAIFLLTSCSALQTKRENRFPAILETNFIDDDYQNYQTENHNLYISSDPSAPDSGPDSFETKASYGCGGVLGGMQGIISYKLGIPYTINERCTWIIYVPKVSAINFTIVENGIIQNTEDNIKIGFFLDSDYKTPQNFNEIVLSHNSLNKNLSVPGPVAFVRFSSDSSLNGLGFKIVYNGIKTNVSLPFKFSNYYYNKDYGTINYPSNGALYSHLERVSFVIQPKVPIYLALKYYDGNCGVQKDYLTVFQRDGSSLQLIQQFCNSSVSVVPYWSSSNQEFFVTFHSSISAVNKGFQLIWVPSQ